MRQYVLTSLMSQELCAESPVQEEDCQADLDTWNKRFLKMLKDEKKEENTQEKTPRPALDFGTQHEQREREMRQRLNPIKSNSYNNLYGKLIK